MTPIIALFYLLAIIQIKPIGRWAPILSLRISDHSLCTQNGMQLSDASGAILGFIPLNRSHAYHSLAGFPIVFLENDKKSQPTVLVHSVSACVCLRVLVCAYVCLLFACACVLSCLCAFVLACACVCLYMLFYLCMCTCLCACAAQQLDSFWSYFCLVYFGPKQDVDRNALLPSKPVFDSFYSQRLTALSTESPLRWTLLHLSKKKYVYASN